MAENLLENNHNIMIVDFDPEVVNHWLDKGIKAEYADAQDPELPSLLPIKNTNHIISTSTNVETNIRLLKFMEENNFEGKITTLAQSDNDEEKLKECGSYTVLRPFKEAATKILENSN
nr:NAD-binding protein [Antarcticibacterium flavum]